MEISNESLTLVSGCGVTPDEWAKVQERAQKICPNTMAQNPTAPTDGDQARKIANQCADEGHLSFIARGVINSQINKYFPSPSK